jgi:SAM-dependent methyltransferase
MNSTPHARKFKEVRCAAAPASVDDVDEANYWAANPDVKAAGVPARQHFADYGRMEGRVQWINDSAIAEIREEKLSAIAFKPPYRRRRGQPLNALSPEMIAQFDIPNAPPVSANQYPPFMVEELRANADKMYLDLGAGLRFHYYSNVVNTEIYPSICTDVVCVGEDLPFEDAQFDVVMAFSVLEHVRYPWRVAQEMCRVLKPGGKVPVDYPFLQGVHGYPHHFFNATPMGCVSLFEDHCDIVSSSINVNNQPIFSLYWILFAWRTGLSPQDALKFDSVTVGELLARPPDQQLDAFYNARLSPEIQRVIPAGSNLVATRKTDAAPRPVPAMPRRRWLDRFSRASWPKA